MLVAAAGALAEVPAGVAELVVGALAPAWAETQRLELQTLEAVVAAPEKATVKALRQEVAVQG